MRFTCLQEQQTRSTDSPDHQDGGNLQGNRENVLVKGWGLYLIWRKTIRGMLSSYLPWFEVFYKLLNILAEYTAKGQDCQWKELLETLYNLPLPEPGSTVHLSVHSYFTTPDTRELPSIPENRNLTEYFVAVDVNNMLHLYASMLYERRVLISCSKLSTLTACIHGSAAMLYPMFWQHVYIPVLPPHLLDYCW
ncbi:DENN domain-containing protein 1A-like [Rhincodon typus]|uniref:DENN domain-containing protein 1A-like n=1 Tax=Rhincodon typus TaxID=259920 RepID=UPI002030011B|nr:DENN domain-containing protein 1A-like [Rhincodon typus]